jgi:hypothetical protein
LPAATAFAARSNAPATSAGGPSISFASAFSTSVGCSQIAFSSRSSSLPSASTRGVAMPSRALSRDRSRCAAWSQPFPSNATAFCTTSRSRSSAMRARTVARSWSSIARAGTDGNASTSSRIAYFTS